jgi:hypothetical protein
MSENSEINNILSRYGNYRFKLTKFEFLEWIDNESVDRTLQQFLAHHALTIRHLQINCDSPTFMPSMDFILRKMKLESLAIDLYGNMEPYSEIPENSYLKKLEVYKWTPHKTFEALIRIYNNIQELVLKSTEGYWTKPVDEATVQMLLQNLPHLKRLRLPTLSSYAVVESKTLEEFWIRSANDSLLINCQNLKMLTISDHKYKRVQELERSLISCYTPNLECLIIDTHCSITKQFLDSIKRFCPKLHTLKVHESCLSADVKEEKIRIYFIPNDSKKLRCRIELVFGLTEA